MDAIVMIATSAYRGALLLIGHPSVSGTPNCPKWPEVAMDSHCEGPIAKFQKC